MLKNHKLIYIYLLITTGILFFCILSWGAIKIPFYDIFISLAGGEIKEPAYSQIVWDLRLPRAFCALLAGASLGLAGLLMQTFFQNPLAGPFVLGINSGSSLAVALWIMGGASLGLSVPENLMIGGAALSSILGGAVVFLLLIFASVRIKGNIILLVIGLLFGYFSSGLISILISITNADKIKTFLMWTLGSFQGKSTIELSLLVGLVGACSIWSFLLAKRLNALLLGESYARSMGLNFFRFKIEALSITAILSGVVTSICGPIAFIGIMAPHIARRIFSSQDHFVMIPAVLLTGACLALFAEFISGLGVTLILPINAILGLLGAPFILFFLLKKRRSLNE